MHRVALAVVLFGLGIAPDARAQIFTGRIDVTVEDTSGGRVPGVEVALAGPMAQTVVADAQGQVHFLNLPIGVYSVSASLPGFNKYVNDVVEVIAGAATPLLVRLAAAGSAEHINVIAATSVIDLTRQTTTTNVTLDELQNVPTSRDPWVVLQGVASIYLDRVNVGGSESGQQSLFMGKGAVPSDNTWHIDGVPITDMAIGTTGASPAYYDFDVFRAIAVTTGGAQAQIPTAGVQLNLVLKKGANAPHGSARGYFEGQQTEGRAIGNRLDRYLDYGAEAGGPVIKNRLWGWLSLGKTDIRNLTLTNQLDETHLRNLALKVDATSPRGVRGNFTLFQDLRAKNGRDAGPTRPIETAWDESSPTTYSKGEGNFVIGRKLVVAARGAYISAGSTLTPIGGVDRSMYQDDSLVWHSTYFLRSTERPQWYAASDASYFVGKHELKFGFSWRKTPVDSQSVVPGNNNTVTFWTGYPLLQAVVQQDYALNTTGRYASGFLTDTLPLGRLTLIAGVRYDHQSSSLEDISLPAARYSSLLPAVTAQAVANAYDFGDLTPRVGATYALDPQRRTVVRGSYAMFASQLPANSSSFISPIQPHTYVIYSAIDRNSNGVADLNEFDFVRGDLGSSNIDRERPGTFTTKNRIRATDAPRTREVLVGLDRALTATFSANATFTYRYLDRFIWNEPIGARPEDYRQTGVLTGTFPEVGAVSVPIYGISTTEIGREAVNRAGYHRRYLGFEAGATKRMADHWTARLAFASSAWNEYFDDAARSVLDPTRTPAPSDEYVNSIASGPLVSGGPVVVSAESAGKSGIYMIAPHYQLTSNGWYQAPHGITFAANLLIRQGYGEPFFRSRVVAGDSLVPTKNVLLVDRADRFRLDAVKLVDVRAEKTFTVRHAVLAFDFDVFNLFNSATVLARQFDARSTAFGQVLETMNPRIARLAARVSF